ncbi:CoA ester lyase [Winogradskyella sp.]|nr:CoA ester lyase [Winogradskyella sp.]
MMFVPGHNKKIIASASKSTADALIFDLEDSVQPSSNKALARDIIIESVADPIFDRFQKFVRLNEIETDFFLQDVLQVTQANIDGFLLSKTNNKEDVQYLDSLLTSIERERHLEHGTFSIIPILESAQSIVKINEIATASSRIVALGFGSEDYVSDIQGIRDFDSNVSIAYPRSLVPIVARAHKLEAIDAAYIKVHDLEGLQKHTETGKILGYGGMWVLHPKQNDIVNQVFSPTAQEYEDAKNFLRLYEEAKNNNKGVAIIEGKFVGPPLITKSNDIIARVHLIARRRKLFDI